MIDRTIDSLQSAAQALSATLMRSGTLAVVTLKRHQDWIGAGLTDIDRRLAEHDEHHSGGRAFLHDSLRLLTDAYHAYQHSDDGNRRLANQALYRRLELSEDEELRPTLAEPFASITGAARGNETEHEHITSCDVGCSRRNTWVELGGRESRGFG
ncbi:hypothetical protein [Brevibacterium picturae]|uniref:Uncharacterized protein n=1 Tax=Brevibacterium picturae TaxID=260553 RepID=A0ABN2CH83_9MICO